MTTQFVESSNFRAEHFVGDHGRGLTPQDAVAALLVHEDGRYIMQLRDSKPGIFYPGHWGCFGGAVEPGETPLEALRRELHEEIGFEMGDASQFTQFDFDFSSLGYAKVYRMYFEMRVTDVAFRRFVLSEGADMQALGGEELVVRRRLTPYDAFAIWMHMNRPGARRSQQI